MITFLTLAWQLKLLSKHLNWFATILHVIAIIEKIIPGELWNFSLATGVSDDQAGFKAHWPRQHTFDCVQPGADTKPILIVLEQEVCLLCLPGA